MSYEIGTTLIPGDAITRALRAINLDLFTSGYGPDTLKAWTEDHHWLPHLWDHQDIQALASYLPAHWKSGVQQPPQIIVQPPYYGPDAEPFWHVDAGPDGGEWRTIVGIPLTIWSATHGTIHIDGVGPLWLAPGEAVMIPGGARHAVGKNTGGLVRYGVYFRWAW